MTAPTASYSVLDVTSSRTQMDWYVTGDRATENPGPPRLDRSFQTAAGSGRLTRAPGLVGG